MKVLVIGAGNMGLTYAEAIAKSGHLKKGDLMITDKSPARIDELKSMNLFDVYDNPKDCLPHADLVFLAVKPFHCKELFAEIKDYVDDQQIFISIMAGVTIDAIQADLGISKVVRAMPNLPAQIGKGMTSFLAAEEVSRVELGTVENLLNTTGKTVKVISEKYIDASTGISGSGPAYVFYFMQSMMEAAVKMGFSQGDSKLLVTQTFEGAVALFNRSDISADSWMNRVASKGGTTRAALDSLDDNNVKNMIKEAAYAAFNRAVELGK